jgi:hypothetical protein
MSKPEQPPIHRFYLPWLNGRRIPFCCTEVKFSCSRGYMKFWLPPSQHQPPVAIMSNPNWGRGGLVPRVSRGGPLFNGHAGPPNGRGGPTTNGRPASTAEGTSGGEASASTSQLATNANNQPLSDDDSTPRRGGAVHRPRGSLRGRGFAPNLDRGSGRGRGAVVHPDPY